MHTSILSRIESERSQLIEALEPSNKALNGQFMTPATIARAMAGMFTFPNKSPIRLLDPGAGVGSLSLAFLERLIQGGYKGYSVEIVAFETDSFLASEFMKNAEVARKETQSLSWDFNFTLIEEDFISTTIKYLRPKFLEQVLDLNPFSHIIINPPYRKLSAKSTQRKMLDEIGIRANNLYSAFVALSISLLADDGELVAITPRSFCNGPYFNPFRKFILSQSSFKHIHVFEARNRAFKEDEVLQENVIFHIVKNTTRENVEISSSSGRDINNLLYRRLPHSRVVNPKDPNSVIRIPTNDFDDYVLDRMMTLESHLADLDLEVSTGPVVDFRLRDSIQDEFMSDTAPLIYPSHIKDQSVQWPQEKGRKPNAIRVNGSTKKWLFPNGNYVVTRRFSSKEEKRRIYPALFRALEKNYELIGFENHLNIIHSAHSGIDLRLAKGLVAYFSSTIVDLFFRQFSGHTQVNASDLRVMPVPSLEILLELAKFFTGNGVEPKALDTYLESLFRGRYGISSPDPVILSRN